MIASALSLHPEGSFTGAHRQLYVKVDRAHMPAKMAGKRGPGCFWGRAAYGSIETV
jgi:hypothetical protein